MGTLIAGLVVFFLTHSISIVNESWRNQMVTRLGELPWKGLYALVSIIGLALIVTGYGLARQDPLVLYTTPNWLNHVTALLMIPVFPLLLATYLPGRIKTATKHPMLVATKTWALAHLLANGTWADVLLFGSFLAWAVADRISMKRRTQRPLPGAPQSKLNDIIAVVGGLAIYVGFAFWGHQALIGVPVMTR
jgi:uncharacterized membrane protein